ncbi:MAG: LysM peptidoglycan-binding domain-containing protein [Bradymonadaceae bacterium]
MRTRQPFDDQPEESDATEAAAPDTGRLLAWWVGSVLIAAAVGLGYGNEVWAQGNYGDSGGSKTDYHEVRDGDTLYDLSGRYFGNSRQWPKLWSYNPHITNPHWIYPGDIIYLIDRRRGMRLATAGFVAKQDPPFVGRIVDSPKASRLLGQYDSCWVGFGDNAYVQMERDRMSDSEIEEIKDPNKKIEKKDRFAIVKQAGPLTNQEGDKIGQKYLMLGSLVITDTSKENLQTAYIDQSWREIERGAFLVPYERQVKMIDHQPAKKDLVAKIIGSLAGTFDVAQFQYVFINKGASDGVRVGNRLYAYQQSVGLPKQWSSDGEEIPDKIPWRRLGRLRVIDVNENFSTAMITASDKELGIGDRLEMYKGN